MKNKRKTCFALALAASVCLSAATSAHAGYADIYDFFGEISENTCYIIDFMDYDGNLLDSKICTYGEKLTDIIIPKPKEDEEYIYQFSGWEPQVSETVSESAAYMATYQKIRKDGAEEPDCTPEPIIQEKPTLPNRVSSDTNPNGLAPEDVTQVSSTSYDVTHFTLETPTPKEEEPADITDAPALTDPSPQPETAKKEDILPQSPQKDTQHDQTKPNASLPTATPSTPEQRNVEISPQVSEPSDADTPNAVFQNPENNFSQASPNTDATLQRKPADATPPTKSKHPAKSTPSENTKNLSENAQMTKIKSSISASAKSKSARPKAEDKQSYRINFAVPALFIGIAIFSGAARKARQRKRTQRN